MAGMRFECEFPGKYALSFIGRTRGPSMYAFFSLSVLPLVLVQADPWEMAIYI